MTDRVQVMYSGLIVERGTTEDIFYYPKHPYTWALIKSVPGLSTKNKASLYSISGTPPDLLNPPVGCPFAARCQYCMEACLEMMPEVTTISDTHSVSCWLMHPDAPKIESTFAGGGAV
jgi:oligopeptide transport system ATP-binding protein